MKFSQHARPASSQYHELRIWFIWTAVATMLSCIFWIQKLDQLDWEEPSTIETVSASVEPFPAATAPQTEVVMEILGEQKEMVEGELPDSE